VNAHSYLLLRQKDQGEARRASRTSDDGKVADASKTATLDRAKMRRSLVREFRSILQIGVEVLKHGE
jgi:hypothetical protein